MAAAPDHHLLRATPQEGPAVWRRADVADESSWAVTLTDGQRSAIVGAARRAAAEGITVEAVTADTVPLRGLDADLAAWSDALERGRGFLLLRGFPVDELSPDETELGYVALGAHLGTPVGQNSSGDVLTHIRDERLPASAGQVRLYRTNLRQDFHTDAADIIGLLCLQRAASGGESRLVSSWAIYNEMLEQRPDLLAELAGPMAWDRQGDVPTGAAPWFSLPPLTFLDGVPRLFYVGWYIRDSQRHADAPRLTSRQVEAMDMLERLANDPDFHLPMDFRPGDVQLINNGRILHAREAYEDDPRPDRRRHLLRLWLAAHRFASVEPGLRGGIAEPGRRPS